MPKEKGISFADIKEATEYANTLKGQGYEPKVTYFPSQHVYRVTKISKATELLEDELEDVGEGEDFTLEDLLEGKEHRRVKWGEEEEKWAMLEKKRKGEGLSRREFEEVSKLPGKKQSQATSLLKWQKKTRKEKGVGVLPGERQIRKGVTESTQFAERILSSATPRIAKQASMKKVIPIPGDEEHGYLAKIGITGAPRIAQAPGGGTGGMSYMGKARIGSAPAQGDIRQMPRPRIVSSEGIPRIVGTGSGRAITEMGTSRITSKGRIPEISSPVPTGKFQTPYLKKRRKEEEGE